MSRLLRPLGDRGDAGAQYLLWLMYADGQGVLQDDAEAAKCYRMAADQGHASAQYNLGLMYTDGLSAAEDQVRAHI